MPLVNVLCPRRTGMRAASIRTSSDAPSSAITTRIAFDPASIAPSLVGTHSSYHAPRGSQRRDLALLLRRRRRLRARALDLRGAGVVGDLDLVTLGDAALHLDVQAVGEAELDIAAHERLRRRLALDVRLAVLVVLDKRFTDREDMLLLVEHDVGVRRVVRAHQDPGLERDVGLDLELDRAVDQLALRGEEREFAVELVVLDRADLDLELHALLIFATSASSTRPSKMMS